MKYVALLRGINVGGNNKIDMKELKKSFENNGFSTVSTYINSGNIIFESDLERTEVVKKIEGLILKDFGLEIRALIRNADNIKFLAGEIGSSWQNNSEQKTDIMFLWDEVDNSNVLDDLKINKSVDNVYYLDGAIIWNLQKKNYSRSGMNDLAKSKLYKQMTVRNINTVRKLADLL